MEVADGIGKFVKWTQRATSVPKKKSWRLDSDLVATGFFSGVSAEVWKAGCLRGVQRN